MPINQHSLERTGEVAVEGGIISFRFYEPHDPEKARRTPIFFVHGGPGGSHALMYDSLGSLADERPVIFYDQLGSYFSPAELPQELMRLDRFTDELDRLIKALKYDRVIVFGHSWGGAVAADFALRHPERLESLILSCPLLSTNKWIDDCNELLAHLPADVQETIRRCEADGTTDGEAYKEAEKIFSLKHYCRLEKWPDAVLKSFRRTNRRIYLAMWGPSEFSCTGLLKDLDLIPRLHEIKIPTFIICGEFDTATPRTMQMTQTLIKGSRLAIIPNSGHLAYVDNNDLYLAETFRFLGNCPSTFVKPQSPAKAGSTS